MWKGSIVAYFKPLSRNFVWRDCRRHERPQLGKPASGRIFEPEISRTLPNETVRLYGSNECNVYGPKNVVQ